ncbi:MULTISPECIES: class I SAM-dependent DNA methyltransferase [Pseudonocardia]|uniref:class I SAM-dependent DNA methyltransferase n=1 Tax=Pseudonocardia TaxID=1847 RepID=UPI001AD75F08|nr:MULTISPECIES: class I SAM-dependent methyltransferase [Pseudonocardia]MBO4239811.1 methyltransferase domain-containing protein [Pseudonocardia alni]
MAVERSEPTYRLALPEPTTSFEQDAEYCVLDLGQGWTEYRFHDYDELFKIPGLYEKLFYDILQCQSPAVVAGALAEQLDAVGVDPSGLRVLDVGAGNGIVAEELRARGVGKVVGIDILPEAREAAERDRPGVYDDYHVVDLTDLDDETTANIAAGGFDALTCVAALGFGDIPPAAFRAAFDMVAVDGFVAITLRDDFLSDGDTSGFAGLISSLLASGELEELGATVYRHRLATSRDPLLYRAVVARKRRPRG